MVRGLVKRQLPLLEAAWCEELLPLERRGSRLRRVWARARVRLLRRRLLRPAREQAHRALEFWHRADAAQPHAPVELKARWSAVYALAQSSSARRTRLVEPFARALAELVQSGRTARKD